VRISAHVYNHNPSCCTHRFIRTSSTRNRLVFLADCCRALLGHSGSGRSRFQFGIKYGDMLGHRGFTHSIFFAALLAALITFAFFQKTPGSSLTIFLFLFLSTLSHPLLDALTNGGLGVGLFAPFSKERYFFPYRPIEVSPIGVGAFFSHRGATVILSELKWVWVPSAIFFGLGHLLKRLRDLS
jgi:inner membrane protein